jgi:prefoldin subunit 5
MLSQNQDEKQKQEIKELKKQLEILQIQLAQLHSQIVEITQTTDKIFYRDWSMFST